MNDCRPVRPFLNTHTYTHALALYACITVSPCLSTTARKVSVSFSVSIPAICPRNCWCIAAEWPSALWMNLPWFFKTAFPLYSCVVIIRGKPGLEVQVGSHYHCHYRLFVLVVTFCSCFIPSLSPHLSLFCLFPNSPPFFFSFPISFVCRVALSWSTTGSCPAQIAGPLFCTNLHPKSPFHFIWDFCLPPY